MPADAPGQRTGVLRPASPADGRIDALQSSAGELLCQTAVGVLGECYDQQAARVAVEAVHDTRPQAMPHVGQFAVAVQKSVDQSAVGVARRRVHDKADRLVDHDDLVVFVHGAEWNILSHRRHLRRPPRHKTDLFTGSQPVSLRPRLTVDQRGHLAQSGLDLITAQIGATLVQKAIDAEPLLIRLHHEDAWR